MMSKFPTNPAAWPPRALGATPVIMGRAQDKPGANFNAAGPIVRIHTWKESIHTIQHSVKSRWLVCFQFSV